MLVFGVAFVVALNLALQLDRPSSSTTYQGLAVFEVQPQPGNTIAALAPFANAAVMLDETGQRLADDNIDRLRTWSLIGVVFLAISSGIGGYIVSGVMLRPVRDITAVAAEINASSLGRRINHAGPDDELKALADTFDSMIARLESSFEQQAQFVQDASHELRTPLTAIRTNIEVVEMMGDTSADEYRDLVATIKTQTDRLARLTEDLLLLARSDHEESDLEAVSLDQVATEVQRELAPLAERKQVRVVVENGRTPDVLAIPSFLYRCVLNLTDNAIKYSGSDATVRITTSTTPTVGRVIVADTGPGIPFEHQRSVFDRFYRVDRGRSRREGGSGLGLAIVKQLVELQGGSIQLSSQPGEGTTFVLSFPLAGPEPSDAEQLPAEQRSSAAPAFQE